MATMGAAIRPTRRPRSVKATQRRNRMQMLLINDLSDATSISQKLLGHIIGALRVVGCLSQVRWTSTWSCGFLVKPDLLDTICAILMIQ
jgi:hypothetical protein